jgi:hypothetical protein
LVSTNRQISQSGVNFINWTVGQPSQIIDWENPSRNF